MNADEQAALQTCEHSERCWNAAVPVLTTDLCCNALAFWKIQEMTVGRNNRLQSEGAWLQIGKQVFICAFYISENS